MSRGRSGPHGVRASPSIKSAEAAFVGEFSSAKSRDLCLICCCICGVSCHCAGSGPKATSWAPPSGEATPDLGPLDATLADEEPVAWAEGCGAAFPQEHTGVDRGGAVRDRV